MAEGYHIASGKLGVVIVPKAGLGNAASNIYNALMDRSSVLTITARDSSEFSERQIDLTSTRASSCRGPRCRVMGAVRECACVRGVLRRTLYLKSNRRSVPCLPRAPPGSPSGPSCLELERRVVRTYASSAGRSSADSRNSNPFFHPERISGWRVESDTRSNAGFNYLHSKGVDA